MAARRSAIRDRPRRAVPPTAAAPEGERETHRPPLAENRRTRPRRARIPRRTYPADEVGKKLRRCERGAALRWPTSWSTRRSRLVKKDIRDDLFSVVHHRRGM